MLRDRGREEMLREGEEERRGREMSGEEEDRGTVVNKRIAEIGVRTIKYPGWNLQPGQNDPF